VDAQSWIGGAGRRGVREEPGEEPRRMIPCKKTEIAEHLIPIMEG
jgi:hypothetical protein